MADAGIESTPFDRAGRAIVTRGAEAGGVIPVAIALISVKEKLLVSA